MQSSLVAGRIHQHVRLYSQKKDSMLVFMSEIQEVWLPHRSLVLMSVCVDVKMCLKGSGGWLCR